MLTLTLDRTVKFFSKNIMDTIPLVSVRILRKLKIEMTLNIGSADLQTIVIKITRGKRDTNDSRIASPSQFRAFSMSDDDLETKLEKLHNTQLVTGSYRF